MIFKWNLDYFEILCQLPAFHRGPIRVHLKMNNILNSYDRCCSATRPISDPEMSLDRACQVLKQSQGNNSLRVTPRALESFFFKLLFEDNSAIWSKKYF